MSPRAIQRPAAPAAGRLPFLAPACSFQGGGPSTTPPADAEGLTLFELSKSFGSLAALSSVSLRVRPGEVVGLFGPNGAGKTTLLRVAAGLDRPSSGRVLIDGIDLALSPSHAKSKVGWVGERPVVYDDLTSAENLEFFGRLYGLLPREAKAAAAASLRAFGLAHRAADPAGTLSHGMRQRLSLARALLHRPTVLLLDEPFEGLDPAGQAFLLKLLTTDAARGARAVLLATHQVDLGLAACDRVAVADRGRLVRIAPRPGIEAPALARELAALGGEPPAP